MAAEDAVQDFARTLLGIYTGGVLTKLIDIGQQTGLFEVAAQGPGTSRELADRAGLQERYVREWLGAMATSGIFSYDANSNRYALPPAHAASLTGAQARNVSPMSGMIDHFGQHLPQLVRCFREGGGIPYSRFRPDFTCHMDAAWRRIYDEQLIDGFLGRVDGLHQRLAGGIDVLDVGCGSGHALNLMAREYPRSRFLGYDLAEDAIAEAEAEAVRMGLSNVRFEARDVAKLPAAGHDLVTAFDAIHDQLDPATVLRRIHDALALDGTFLMIDFKFASGVEGNIGNPFAPMYYGISLMHCMTVSLAHGGAGLGAVWGIDKAREMLAVAGFSKVHVLDSPRPQNCIYVCRK
jgi:2-polyprenyl-3-methyl-5-hydroxy-6-metoxy-1,4-benzoquinol methylase